MFSTSVTVTRYARLWAERVARQGRAWASFDAYVRAMFRDGYRTLGVRLSAEQAALVRAAAREVWATGAARPAGLPGKVFG